MAAIISLDEAKRHLRVDDSDNDEDILAKTEQAIAIIYGYLKKPIPNVDGSPPDEVDGSAKASILLALTGLYDGRDPATEIITPAIVALLMRLRDPALA